MAWPSKLNCSAMKNHFIAILILVNLNSIGQSLSSKSANVSLDFSDPKKSYATSAPSIHWQLPANDVSYAKDGKLPLQLEIRSKVPIKVVSILIVDKQTSEKKAETQIPVKDDSKNLMKIERTITLPDGVNQIEVKAENEDGIKSTVTKTVYAGAAVVAEATKLDRKDYALIFVTDKYDNWTQLVNPVFDGRTISQSLQKNYGFQTEVVENPSREQVFLKLREYAERKYNPLDQLLVFFAGHGFYDPTFKEGFVVPREAVQDDMGRTSYIRHSELRSTINNNPCEHILLVMDVCFGGTFDEDALRALDDAAYGEASQSDIILRKLQFKTRKYITSGGKEYVSDGVAGNHSPFARQFIAALDSQGSNDGMLTLSELNSYLEKLKTAPQFGKFGSDKLGSEFLFVVK